VRAALSNARVVAAIRELNVQLEARVRERTAELDEAQARLAHAEKLASLGRLVAGVAHEINNPLNFVQANLPPLGETLDEIEAAMRDYEETLAENADRLGLDFAGGDDDRSIDNAFRAARDGLRDMREGAQRVREVVESLRRIAGRGALPSGPVDLRRVVEQARALVAPRVPAGVKVALLDGEAAPVRGAAGELERLFVNLLANALDAVGARGRIEIALRRDGGFVEATVDDDGPGVPPELRPRLFTPFFTTKPEGQGTGLGLSICDGIARRAGGTLEVADSPLGGARFLLRLPIEPPTHDEDQ
jgi:two-component system sensor histidine kinase HupT/HoxJ